MNQFKKLDVRFFASLSGAEPVREWLLSLSKQDKAIIGEDILKVQYSWPIGKPLVDNLGNGLWEVRSRLNDRIARVIFFIFEKKMILLHGFIKKTQKTPIQELEIALKRKKLFESNL
jgi:phage-related protein